MGIRNSVCPEELILNEQHLNKHVECEYRAYVADADDREGGEMSVTFLGPHVSRGPQRFLIHFVLVSPY